MPFSTPLTTMSTLTFSNEFPKLTHGNYHVWAPHMMAELQHYGIWHFCTGDEYIPATKPSATSIPASVTINECVMLEWRCREAQQIYINACHWNDQAIRMIMTKIELSQYEGLKNKPAKEVWDTLKVRHAGTHTGLSFTQKLECSKEVHQW
jgi:hypothetical protein